MGKLILFSIDHPKILFRALLLICLFFILLVALPSLWPNSFRYLHPLQVDTDPENMLAEDEAVRVFHNAMKREFSLYDMVVLGVVNDKHPNGVFNADSLRRIYELTEYAKTLSRRDKERPGQRTGVILGDLITPSSVDNIDQAGPGTVRFEWLMPRPPATDAEALAIRDKARRIPFLNGTIISEDEKAIALYFPITSKDISYEVASRLRNKIATFKGDEQYHITGLPVSEDQFGVEMFIQMAVCAPLAMIIVSLLMLYFFQRVALVAASMGVAMVAVIFSMGLLIATGNTLHIMSSMIPIFIMPIAVLDSIHILSEFFDRHKKSQDRRVTIIGVMDTLFKPMLFTSLTTAIGFLSLTLTPIPPVQVFGLFIAIGVMVAWVVTITVIPACIMAMRPESLQTYGAALKEDLVGSARLSRLLAWIGKETTTKASWVLAGTAVVSAVAIYGLSQIVINDNPVRWFAPSHEIRIADRILNEHFGGTYMAYLALEAPAVEQVSAVYVEDLNDRLRQYEVSLGATQGDRKLFFTKLKTRIEQLAGNSLSKREFLGQLESFIEGLAATDSAARQTRYDGLLFIDQERQRDHVFKQPEVLNYVLRLQQHLLTTDVVGKSNSVSDIVATVNRELYSGDNADLRVPDSADAVAQTMLTFQSSHRPQDLWHFITPDFRKASIWVQLQSGDNRDMSRVVASVDQFIAENPPPVVLSHNWFGLNYINVVWQEKMVQGMLFALIGSFVAVLLMMTILFRSLLWGLLSMVPLTVTIGAIYGVIGLIGKDYDMPIAVLSALSLGLAVDYAVHFVTRTRMIYAQVGSWEATIPLVFAEPARAISRNAIVNGVGFMPLLIAPLVPYQTVGVFIAAILLTAGIATLIILPALITSFKGLLSQNGECTHGIENVKTEA